MLPRSFRLVTRARPASMHGVGWKSPWLGSYYPRQAVPAALPGHSERPDPALALLMTKV